MDHSISFNVSDATRTIHIRSTYFSEEECSDLVSGTKKEISAKKLQCWIIDVAARHELRGKRITTEIEGQSKSTETDGYELVLEGFRVTGALCLRDIELIRSVSFHSCNFDSIISLKGARIRSLCFLNTTLSGIDLSGARIEGSLRFGLNGKRRDSFRSSNMIDLSLCTVSGDVVISGAELMYSPLTEYNAYDASINDGCAIMAGGLVANAFWLTNSIVNGRVFLAGSRLSSMVSIRHSELYLPIANISQESHANDSNLNVEIIGNLEFKYAALAVNDAKIGTKLYIQQSEIHGQTKLARSEVEGDCQFQGSKFFSAFSCFVDYLIERSTLTPYEKSLDYFRDLRSESHHLAAMHASRADIGGGVFLNGAKSFGEMRLKNTRIRGVLNSRGANFSSLAALQYNFLRNVSAATSNEKVFFADEIDEQLYETENSDIVIPSQRDKEIREFQKKIGRALSGIALCFDRARINSGVFLAKEKSDSANKNSMELFRSYGEVSVRQAEVGGSFNCKHARMFAPPFFVSDESVPLHSTELGQEHFVALAMSGSHIGGTIFLSGESSAKKFFSLGEVRLRGATVDGNIIFFNGYFRHAPIQHYTSAYRHIVGLYHHRPVINLRTAKVRGSIFFTPDSELFKTTQEKGTQKDASAVIYGGIDFKLAECAALQDSRSSWPKGIKIQKTGNIFARLNQNGSGGNWIQLDGFSYKALSSNKLSWFDRLKWLRRSPRSFDREGKELGSLQPYEQLASVLKDQGYIHDSNYILFKRGALAWMPADSSARSNPLGGLETFLGRRLHTLIGPFRAITYFPIRGLFAITGLAILSCLLFSDFYNLGIMRPAEEEILLSDSYNLEGRVPKEIRFNALAYTADLIVPGLDLRHERFWMPKPKISAAPTPNTPSETDKDIKFTSDRELQKWEMRRLEFYNRYYIPYLAEFFARAFGWILFSLTIIGFSGILRPDRQ